MAFAPIVCGSITAAETVAASESRRINGKLFAIEYKEWNAPEVFCEVVDKETLDCLNEEYNVLCIRRYQNGVCR